MPHSISRSPTPSGQKHTGVLRKREHGFAVQVVVVIVRQDQAAQRWQIGQRDRRRMEAFRTEMPKGRGTLGEHGVGQPELAAQFQQHRRMTEPVEAAVGRRIELRTR